MGNLLINAALGLCTLVLSLSAPIRGNVRLTLGCLVGLTCAALAIAAISIRAYLHLQGQKTCTQGFILFLTLCLSMSTGHVTLTRHLMHRHIWEMTYPACLQGTFLETFRSGNAR